MTISCYIIALSILIIAVTCYRTAHNFQDGRFSWKLFSKMKVKLLADVKGHGKKGEIILVSPAMYTNVFLPNKQAKAVTEEEIKREQKECAETQQKLLSKAMSIGAQIDSFKGVQKLTLKKKVGSNGQLFGSVMKKTLIEEIQRKLPEILTFEEKFPIVLGIKAISDEKSELDEIRKAGLYEVIIQVHPNVSSKFEIEVTSEK